jgi:hypothetical protein
MIKLGMIWYEPNPKNTMLQTVSEALAYYTKKYPNNPPNLVTVNPDEYVEDDYPIPVVPWKCVTKRVIFVGIAENPL